MKIKKGLFTREVTLSLDEAREIERAKRIQKEKAKELYYERLYPYMCDNCSKRFSWPRELKGHQSLQSKEYHGERLVRVHCPKNIKYRIGLEGFKPVLKKIIVI